MALPIVVSSRQINTLLAARQKGQMTVEVSPDLGLSIVPVTITSDGAVFTNGECLTWGQVEKIKKSPSNCFFVEHGAIRVIQVFSEETNRHCSLFPTQARQACSSLVL